MVRSVLLQFSCLLLWRVLMAYSGVHVILFTLFISGLFQHSSTLNKLGGIGGFQRTIICILLQVYFVIYSLYLLEINHIQWLELSVLYICSVSVLCKMSETLLLCHSVYCRASLFYGCKLSELEFMTWSLLSVTPQRWERGKCMHLERVWFGFWRLVEIIALCDLTKGNKFCKTLQLIWFILDLS